jgi:hypothetical protein
MTERMALMARAHVPWRALALAALLSLLAGAALSQRLRARERSSSALPAVSSKAVSRGGLWSLSSAARASISGAIGAEDPTYRFSATADGFQTANRAQHLRIGFNRSGALLDSHGLELGLSLRAVGYGTSLRAVHAVQPVLSANRITYSRAGLSEWYENGPLGLEQGFTLTRMPAHGPAGPLTLAIALSGDAHASLAEGGQSVTFSGLGSGSLRYGGLSATDATGRALRSWLALDDGELLVHVDTQGAHFPIRIDPLVEEEPQSITGDETEQEEDASSGLSVALSGDGDTALVGAPNGTGSGAAWVFTRSGSTWVQQGPKLALASGQDEDRFGASVALSADGSTALIGAPLYGGGNGAAWIFTRSDSTWKQVEELTAATGGVSGYFGRSVALSADGETALVGAPAARGQGLAWLFTRSESGWSQQGEPLAGAGESGSGRFGRSVALSADGETTLIGAPGDDGNLGAAWLFRLSGSTWTEQGSKLTGSGEAGEGRFGYSTALSGDGSTALVGAPNSGSEDQGAAWAFRQSGSSWSEQSSELTGGKASDEHFGFSVALSSVGDSALIGAPRANLHRGAAWLFGRSEAGWSAAELTAGPSQGGWPRFGAGVALSADGEVALVGAPGAGKKAGAAWVFGPGPSVEDVLSPDPSVKGVRPNRGPAAGGITVEITGTNFSEATAVHFGKAEAASLEVTSPTTIRAVSPAGTGSVDITVTNPSGTSATSSEDQFTYEGGKKGPDKEGGGNDGGEEGITQTTTSGQAGAVLAFGPTSGAACGVSLRSKKISVQARSRVLLELVGTGTGKCSGKLRLRVKIKLKGKRYKIKTIGTATFSITSGKTLAVKLKLNAAGRALLKAGNGRLGASLLIVKSSPAPAQARTASVRLASIGRTRQ